MKVGNLWLYFRVVVNDETVSAHGRKHYFVLRTGVIKKEKNLRQYTIFIKPRKYDTADTWYLQYCIKRTINHWRGRSCRNQSLLCFMSAVHFTAMIFPTV